jgi:hypothetical protein
VLGVGAASLTLAAATPRATVGRTMDLGAGCGIQALLAQDHSDVVVATDRNPRATGFTRLAAALNGVDVDARTGDLLEPVAAEAFDLARGLAAAGPAASARRRAARARRPTRRRSSATPSATRSRTPRARRSTRC